MHVNRTQNKVKILPEMPRGEILSGFISKGLSAFEYLGMGNVLLLIHSRQNKLEAVKEP